MNVLEGANRDQIGGIFQSRYESVVCCDMTTVIPPSVHRVTLNGNGLRDTLRFGPQTSPTDPRPFYTLNGGSRQPYERDARITLSSPNAQLVVVADHNHNKMLGQVMVETTGGRNITIDLSAANLTYGWSGFNTAGVNNPDLLSTPAGAPQINNYLDNLANLSINPTHTDILGFFSSGDILLRGHNNAARILTAQLYANIPGELTGSNGNKIRPEGTDANGPIYFIGTVSADHFWHLSDANSLSIFQGGGRDGGAGFFQDPRNITAPGVILVDRSTGNQIIEGGSDVPPPGSRLEKFDWIERNIARASL
jgi:hypothetical protein